MTRTEVTIIDNLFLPYDHKEEKMKLFHSKESGEGIVIIYNPNILGITRLQDILTFNKDELRNIILYFKTRDEFQLTSVIANFRQYKTEDI